jgi:hypothetical protein
MAGDGTVRGDREDGITLHEDGADRDFARGLGCARSLKGKSHEIDVTA